METRTPLDLEIQMLRMRPMFVAGRRYQMSASQLSPRKWQVSILDFKELDFECLDFKSVNFKILYIYIYILKNKNKNQGLLRFCSDIFRSISPYSAGQIRATHTHNQHQHLLPNFPTNQTTHFADDATKD